MLTCLDYDSYLGIGLRQVCADKISLYSCTVGLILEQHKALAINGLKLSVVLHLNKSFAKQLLPKK